MNFIDKVKEIIGEENWEIIYAEAKKEIRRAKGFEIRDQYGKERWYRKDYGFPQDIEILSLLKQNNLHITPSEIQGIIYQCLLLKAVDNEDEWEHLSIYDAFSPSYYYNIPFSRKDEDTENILTEKFNQLEPFSAQDTSFVIHIEGVHTGSDVTKLLLDELKLENFEIMTDENKILSHFRRENPNLKEEYYTIEQAKKFFEFPNIFFSCAGSPLFTYYYANLSIRLLCDILRILGFAHAPQISFGMWNDSVNSNKMTTLSQKKPQSYQIGFQWEKDAKKFIELTADANLFISFGYKSVQPLMIDSRNIKAVQETFRKMKPIFNICKNPFSDLFIKNVMPPISILSNLTQEQGLGIKLLLINCFLEHLFVPDGITTDNKKYIMAGLYTISPEHKDWFEEIYKFRCQYAHKGYIEEKESLASELRYAILNCLEILLKKLKSRL